MVRATSGSTSGPLRLPVVVGVRGARLALANPGVQRARPPSFWANRDKPPHFPAVYAPRQTLTNTVRSVAFAPAHPLIDVSLDPIEGSSLFLVSQEDFCSLSPHGYLCRTHKPALPELRAEQRRPKGPRGPIGSRSSVPCGFPRLPAAGGRTPSAQGRGGHSLGPGPARRPPVRRANGSSLPVISLGKGPGGPATGECGNPGFEFPPRRCFRTESPLNALPHVPWASVSPPVKQ
nr:uncharacterized protein LOC105491537 [Macaca nemestrina]